MKIRPGGYYEVLKLAYPIVISMVSRTVMTFVDTAMVGRLGTSQMAAVGLAGITTWTILSFFSGLLTCINTFVARYRLYPDSAIWRHRDSYLLHYVKLFSRYWRYKDSNVDRNLCKFD